MRSKLVLLIFITLFLAGCGDSTNKENTNTNSNSNTNTNTNSNSNSNVELPEGTHEVNFYLFYSSTCPHCHDEMNWLESIKGNYPYLKIHYYEVSENPALYSRVKEDYGITSNGVPLTILGNDYYLGFSESRERRFAREIEDMSTKETCDVVARIIDKKSTKECRKQNDS